jgi:hypothetical protein
MPRRSRHEQRHLSDQDTVGMRRAERKEQEELAGLDRNKTAADRAQRIAANEGKENDPAPRPRHVARVGKPLKRAR